MTALSVGLGWVAFALIALLLRGLLVAASKNAPSPPRTQAATGATTHCSVTLCDDAPSIRIYASDEWWDFCQVHGIPYLTEELAS